MMLYGGWGVFDLGILSVELIYPFQVTTFRCGCVLLRPITRLVVSEQHYKCDNPKHVFANLRYNPRLQRRGIGPTAEVGA